MNKFLFQDGNDIKTFLNGSWTTIGQAPATQAMFDASGMSDTSSFTKTNLASLVSSKPVFLAMNYSGTAPQSKITGIPAGKLVLPIQDVDISRINQINSVNVKATVAGFGNIRIIVSIDGGFTWRTWDGLKWTSVLVDPTVVAAQGMTPAVVNARTTADWSALIGYSAATPNPAKTIRFGILIDQSSLFDTAVITYIQMNVNQFGSWDMALQGTDYTSEYPNYTTYRVTLKSNGDFKINYPN